MQFNYFICQWFEECLRYNLRYEAACVRVITTDGVQPSCFIGQWSVNNFLGVASNTCYLRNIGHLHIVSHDRCSRWLAKNLSEGVISADILRLVHLSIACITVIITAIQRDTRQFFGCSWHAIILCAYHLGTVCGGVVTRPRYGMHDSPFSRLVQFHRWLMWMRGTGNAVITSASGPQLLANWQGCVCHALNEMHCVLDWPVTGQTLHFICAFIVRKQSFSSLHMGLQVACAWHGFLTYAIMATHYNYIYLIGSFNLVILTFS